MCKYRPGSRAIFVNSSPSSAKDGRQPASTIQPANHIQLHQQHHTCSSNSTYSYIYTVSKLEWCQNCQNGFEFWRRFNWETVHISAQLHICSYMAISKNIPKLKQTRHHTFNVGWCGPSHLDRQEKNSFFATTSFEQIKDEVDYRSNRLNILLLHQFNGLFQDNLGKLAPEK